jgi:hypothetical protein
MNNPSTDLEMVKVATIDNQIEAQLLVSVLAERGIVHRLRSFHDTAYDGLFQAQRGWGELYAPAQRRDEIVALLSEIRSAR